MPNLLLADEPILKNVEGCEINWKEGKCLTFREVVKKQRGKGKFEGQIRTVKSKVKLDSFFHFFTAPKMPSLDTMNEEEAERLEQAFNEDYDIAQAFRSHIIPKAVLWFTGEVRNSIVLFEFVLYVYLFTSHPFSCRQWKKKWKQLWADYNGHQELRAAHRLMEKIPSVNRAKFPTFSKYECQYTASIPKVEFRLHAY